MRPRRVILLTNTFAAGGAERQLFHLALHLRSLGDDVRVATLLPPGELAVRLAELGVPLRALGGPSERRPLSLLAGAVRLFRQWHPDVVIAFLYQANVVSRIAGRVTGVPVVISSIRNENFGGPRRDLVMRATDRLATVTTTNSHRAAESLVGRRVVPRHRLVVIPNGLDVGAPGRDRPPRHVLRETLGVSGDDFLWLAVGRLHSQKDYPTMWAAFTRVRRDEPTAVLRVAGRGPLRDEMESRLDAAGLRGPVQLIGFRDDVDDLLAAADGLVHASACEGLPGVLMEALAAGLPVAATSVGGTPEIVHHGVSGLLVPPADPGALASAMLRLMGMTPEHRADMGRAGRDHVLVNFGLQPALQRWTDLLDERVQGSRPRADRLAPATGRRTP